MSLFQTTPTKKRLSRIRQLHRAISDLKRGVPVCLTGDTPLLIVAAENAGLDAVSELIALTGQEPILLLGLSDEIAASTDLSVSWKTNAHSIALPRELRRFATYSSIVDPVADGPIKANNLLRVPSPAGADYALKLTIVSRILPALIVAPVPKNAEKFLYEGGFIHVTPSDVSEFSDYRDGPITQIISANLPLPHAATVRVIVFRAEGSEHEQYAIVVGRPLLRAAPLVRLHSECFTGDLLASMRCDCGEQLRESIKLMIDQGAGVLLYLRQEGRGIGLVNKLRTYILQDQGLDTMDANEAIGRGVDERDFSLAAKILKELGLNRIRLLTNNGTKISALEELGILVVERQPHFFPPNGINDDYLATKIVRFGHLVQDVL